MRGQSVGDVLCACVVGVEHCVWVEGPNCVGGAVCA